MAFNAELRALYTKRFLGRQVNRAASIIPQTVVSPGTPYFSITGGVVLITGLVGVFTADVGGAVNANWFHNATVGTDANICAATALATFDTGDILVVTGLLTDAMLPAAHASSTHFGGATALGLRGFVVTTGALGVITDASQTGNWRWMLWYIPLDDGAIVAAV
jgi:hypothetical protein